MTAEAPAADDAIPATATRSISLAGHAARLALVLGLTGLLLAWLAAHTDVLFADGLRYIAQARALERGTLAEGIKISVDHPVYPLAIAAMHRLMPGDGPTVWQAAAQGASIVAALLLVLPLYLISRDLFGDRAALPACAFFYAVPLTGHVFADTLSESTFLLFWAWGLWGALRFLKDGKLGWLVLVVGASGLAYLTRPEGLLLPAALGATLLLSPRWVAGMLRGRRLVVGAAVLVIGSGAVVGPYVVLKGGMGTKPSVARLLGTRPQSDASAVERSRPLDPRQGALKTYALAAKAVVKAATEAMTWPLVPLALLGLLALRPRGSEIRQWTLLAVIGGASALALVRLHATGGYCSPRHALIPVLILIPAAGAGLVAALSWLTSKAELPALARPVVPTVALLGLGLIFAPESLAPVNEGLQGYRDAGRWLTRQGVGDGLVVDVTGWSQFYGDRPSGYTFANLLRASADPAARWVVVREAHLVGPWYYCQELATLVAGRTPVQTFIGQARRRPTRVFVYDLQAPPAERLAGPVSPLRR
jgi:hypothetical protein